jgi:hypothetical protein
MKKLLAMALAAAMLLAAALPAGAADTGRYADFPTGWSRAAMEAAVDNGLLQGSGDRMDPQGKLTRAQMAAVLVRAFGAENRGADLGAYTDADGGAWYYKELGAAVGIGLFEGDGAAGTIRPNDSITREETALVLSRAFKLSGGAEDLAGKKDAAEVSEWALAGVAGLLKAGKMEGYPDGTLKPKSSITREEFAQLMAKLVSVYITAPGEYELDTDGTVVVRAAGAILKNSRIAGDLILGAEVAREDIEIDEATEIGGRILLIAESIGEGETPTGEYENPSSGTTGGGGGGGGGTTTYTLNLTATFDEMTLTTGASGELDDDYFYFEARDYLKSKAGDLKSQLAAIGGTNSIATGMFGDMFDEVAANLTLAGLLSSGGILDKIGVPAGAANDTPTATLKKEDVKLSEIAGSGTATNTFEYIDGALKLEIKIIASKTASGKYTLAFELKPSASAQAYSKTGLAAGAILYDAIFEATGEKLTEMAAGYDVQASDYVAIAKGWFNDSSTDISSLIAVAGSSSATAAQLADKSITMAQASGASFSIECLGATIDVAVS